MTHWRSSGAKSRSCWMEGRATFTIETSSTTMRYATPRTASAFQRLGSSKDDMRLLSYVARLRLPTRSPGTHAAEPLDGDTCDEARWRVRHRWKDDVRPDVRVGEALQKLGRASLLDRCPAVRDEVLRKADFVERVGLHRERHARIALDVAHLLPAAEMARDDLVSFEADPDAADLRTPVRVQRDEVGEPIRLEHRARFGGDLHAAEPTGSACLGTCAWVECVAQSVGDEIRGEHEGGDRKARDDDHQGMQDVRCASVLRDRAPGRCRRVDPKPDE